MPADTKSFDDIISEHFSDEPEDVKEDVVVEEEVPEEKEEEQEQEEEQPEEPEEVEENYEEVVPEKKEKEEKFKDDSHAIKRAKEEGKLRKQLEAEKKEWEIERDRLTSELEQHRTKLSELETTRLKPEDHEDYQALLKEIRGTVADAVEDFDAPGAKKLSEQLGNYTARYRTHKEGKTLEDFKAELCKDLFGEDREFDDLDKDEKKELKDAVKLIRESTAKADKLSELHATLEKKSKSGSLAVGIREYEALMKDYQPLLDSIGELSEDVVEDDPTSVQSIVSRLAKSSPEGKKRVDNAKRDALEVLFGKKPLTQAEIDKYEAGGGSYKELLATREKALNEKRKKLLPIFALSLASHSEIKKILSENNELKTKKESEDSEDEALRKITKKKVKAAPEVKTSKSVSDIFKEYGLDD